MRILFSGMLAGVPGHGGATWAVLQYVLGLGRLGHDVLFVEPVADVTPEARSYFTDVVGSFGLEGRAALVAGGSRSTVGIAYDDVVAHARRADLLVNVNGMLRDPALLDPPPTRLYLDLDPVFNQLWAEEGIDVGLAGHTHFATVGLGLGDPGTPVPSAGVEWLPTPQPVVLAEWPVAVEVAWNGLTTIGNWRSYGTIERDGVRYGQKAHSYRRFFGLPKRVELPVFGALAIHPDEKADLAALTENGWQLLDASETTGTPERYRRFVQGSWAELGIAKEGYVAARSGWFSDRSVCYLASGRPVLAQETGYSAYLPAGEGLLAFEGEDDAVTAVEELARDYGRHRRAARALAEQVFDAQKVLPRLLEAVGLG